MNSNPLTCVEYSKSYELMGTDKQKTIFEKYSKTSSSLNSKHKVFFANKVQKKAEQIQNKSLPDIQQQKKNEMQDQKILFKQLKHLKNKLKLILDKKQANGSVKLNKAESCFIEQIKSLEKQIFQIDKSILNQDLQQSFQLSSTKTEENIKLDQDSPVLRQNSPKKPNPIREETKDQIKTLIPSYLNVVIFGFLVLIFTLFYAMISCAIKL